MGSCSSGRNHKAHHNLVHDFVFACAVFICYLSCIRLFRSQNDRIHSKTSTATQITANGQWSPFNTLAYGMDVCIGQLKINIPSKFIYCISISPHQFHGNQSILCAFTSFLSGYSISAKFAHFSLECSFACGLRFKSRNIIVRFKWISGTDSVHKNYLLFSPTSTVKFVLFAIGIVLQTSRRVCANATARMHRLYVSVLALLSAIKVLWNDGDEQETRSHRIKNIRDLAAIKIACFSTHFCVSEHTQMFWVRAVNFMHVYSGISSLAGITIQPYRRTDTSAPMRTEHATDERTKYDMELSWPLSGIWYAPRFPAQNVERNINVSQCIFAEHLKTAECHLPKQLDFYERISECRAHPARLSTRLKCV